MTRVFTPRSDRTDMVAATAAAPDMSVFIVSMPPAVLIDRPPESNTTPLPTSATVPRGRGGSYVTCTKRGACSEPCPTPATPPMRSRWMAASSSTFTVTPLPRRSLRIASASAAGDFAADGSFTASRAHDTAFAIVTPRSRAACTRAPPRPTTSTSVSRVGFDSPLYLRNWYEPSTTPSASAWAASARSTPSGAASTNVVAAFATFDARFASAAPALRSPSGVTPSRGPIPTSTTAFAPSLPPVGTASVSPALPSKPVSLMKSSSVPPSAASTTSVPGPSSRSANTGTTRRSAETRSAGVFVARSLMGTGRSSVRWLSGAVGTGRAVLALLPARQRVHEIREAVEVGHDVTALQPAGGRGADALTLGPADDRAREVARGRDAVLARQHELAGRVEAARDVVDDGFERADHLVRHERDAGRELRPVGRLGGELRADDEELALEPHQQVEQLRPALALRAREPECRHRLVHRAVRGGPDGVLQDAPAVEQSGRTVVALARVHLHVRHMRGRVYGSPPAIGSGRRRGLR